MFLLLEVFWNIINTTLQSVMHPLFWVIVILVAVQNRRIAKNRQQFFGLGQGNIFKDAASATLMGIGCGLLGSFLLVIMGVSLEGIGIIYLWPLAIILMFISPRFLCFAYSGGILVLTNFFFGFPNIQIPQLMALVAILHIVESFLILISGHLGATPIYTKDKGSGLVVGGFTLQKFWPIPIVALTFLVPGTFDLDSLIFMPTMPDWWPLLTSQISGNLLVIPALMPVVAALGYGDLAVARTPRQKSRISARNLFIYSIVLLGLALLSTEYHYFKLLVGLFAPLGHELVIYLGQSMELKEKPIYVQPGQGVRVLDTVAGSIAYGMGVSTGDVIRTVNGITVNSKYELEIILQNQAGYVEVEYISNLEDKWIRKRAFLPRGRVFGLIPVPEGGEQSYMELSSAGFLQRLWKKI